MEYYIVLSYRKFCEYFSEFKKGDLIGIRIPFKPGEEVLVVDLINRGVEAFPSFLSQLLSKSKCMQAQVLKEFMPPYTFVVKDKTSLLEVMSRVCKEGLYEKKFVTKLDKANCGLGIKLWSSIEEVFNFAGTQVLEYPFVLQPFYENLKDIRVVWLGDEYKEAYQRINPTNFRQNIFFGGDSKPYELSEREMDFCKRVMKRGGFPYAHIDMIYVNGSGPFLGEINLKGGIKGAKISSLEYESIISKITKEYFKSWESRFSPVKYLYP